MKHIIYGLTDPRDGSLFYVGRTCQDIEVRRRQHIRMAIVKDEQTTRSERVREITRTGSTPLAGIIEVVSPADWREAESFWMEFYRSWGIRLTNSAPAGGGGTRSHVIEWTPERLARLGTTGDDILAEEMGVDRKSVAYHRRKLEIPASYDQTRMKPPPPRGGWNRLTLPDAIIAKLGMMPDYLLAAEAGVSKPVIGRCRRELGIASYADTTGNYGQFRDGHYPTRWLKPR